MQENLGGRGCSDPTLGRIVLKILRRVAETLLQHCQIPLVYAGIGKAFQAGLALFIDKGKMLSAVHICVHDGVDIRLEEFI